MPEWDSDEEKEYARKLNIEMPSGTVSGLEAIKVEHHAETPASNRIFLQKAEPQGGLLRLEKASNASLDAMMAFSERYWRGGNAGIAENEDGIPDPLTAAGSRWANFEEKMNIHRAQFHKNKMR